MSQLTDNPLQGLRPHSRAGTDGHEQEKKSEAERDRGSGICGMRNRMSGRENLEREVEVKSERRNQDRERKWKEVKMSKDREG